MAIKVDGSNIIVEFNDNTNSVLKLIGEFVVEKNDIDELSERKALSSYWVEAPKTFTVRAYRNSIGGEIITIVVDNNQPHYSYFESAAEMGLIFGSKFRYVLFEKTLPDSLRMHLQ